MVVFVISKLEIISFFRILNCNDDLSWKNKIGNHFRTKNGISGHSATPLNNADVQPTTGTNW